MSLTTGQIAMVAGGVLLIVALIALLVILRKRDASKGQDKKREGELVQELATIAASEDKDAALAAAPTPEAAAAVESAAASVDPVESDKDEPASEPVSALSLTSAPAAVAVAVGMGDVPVPDATAPVAMPEPEPEVDLAPVPEPVFDTTPELEKAPEPDFTESVEPVAPAFFEPPVGAPLAAAAAPLAFAEPASVTELKPEPTTDTGKAAAVVAERLRAMAEAVEREARSTGDGFRVFDVVLDGFANLPVGTLLPEDDAVTAHSAFNAPSSVATLRTPV